MTTERSTALLLHGYFRSSASYRVRIALNLKGLTHESTAHHLRRAEQRLPTYLALNPQGLVPALENSGQIFTQSLAIIEYLDELHPDPPLLPIDIAARARVRAMAQLIACDIHPLNNLRVLNFLREDLGQDEERVKAWYSHWVTQGFEAFQGLVEQAGGGDGFCYGDAPGLADICLIPQVANALAFGVNMRGFEMLMEIYERAMDLGPFRTAQPQLQPDAA